MHGLIHVVLRSFAQSRFGEEAWVKILDAWEVPGLDDDASREEKEAKLMSLEQQSDAVTVTGVSTAARILGGVFRRCASSVRRVLRGVHSSSRTQKNAAFHGRYLFSISQKY